jgi:hypothetical protein
MVTLVDMFGNSVVIGLDDVYSAEDGPFYEFFLLYNRLLHPQHVLDLVENQKHKKESIRFNHNVSCGMVMVESTCENFEFECPKGEETWLIHNELPQRTQVVKCKQQRMLTNSTSKVVEYSVQTTSSVCDCVASPFTQQPNELMFLLQGILAKQDVLLEKHRLLEEESTRQKVIIDNLSLAVEAAARSNILREVMLSNKLPFRTAPLLQRTPHLIINTVLDLKEQAVTPLQQQQINSSPICAPVSAYYSQVVSVGTNDFNHDYGDINVQISSLKSIIISPSASLNLCIISSTLINIILPMCILVSMAFGILGSYVIFYGDTHTAYFVTDILHRGINDRDWFRTLTVP